MMLPRAALVSALPTHPSLVGSREPVQFLSLRGNDGYLGKRNVRRANMDTCAESLARLWTCRHVGYGEWSSCLGCMDRHAAHAYHYVHARHRAGRAGNRRAGGGRHRRVACARKAGSGDGTDEKRAGYSYDYDRLMAPSHGFGARTFWMQFGSRMCASTKLNGQTLRFARQRWTCTSGKCVPRPLAFKRLLAH